MKTVTDVMNEQASYDLTHGVVAPSSAARINPVLATPGLLAFGAAFAKGAGAGSAVVTAGIAAYTVTNNS